MTTLPIGMVAKLCGKSVASIRHYELRGIVTPARDHFGFRVFTLADIEAIKSHVEQHGRKPASKQRRKAR